MSNDELARRFWLRVQKEGANGCWIWCGCQFNHGYGKVTRKGKHLLAHRVAYELVNGPIPNGMLIRHSCDIQLCVKPNHLLPGTPLDNAQDKVIRGRMHNMKGSYNTNSKLIQEEVDGMREFYKQGMSTLKLAKIFNIAASQVWEIVTYKSWKDSVYG